MACPCVEENMETENKETENDENESPTTVAASDTNKRIDNEFNVTCEAARATERVIEKTVGIDAA